MRISTIRAVIYMFYEAPKVAREYQCRFRFIFLDFTVSLEPQNKTPNTSNCPIKMSDYYERRPCIIIVEVFIFSRQTMSTRVQQPKIAIVTYK